TPSSYKLTVNAGSDAGLNVIGSNYSAFSVDGASSVYGYFRPVLTSDSVSRFEIGAYDLNGAAQGGRDLVLNPLGGNVGVGADFTPNALFSVGPNSEFQVTSAGAVTAVGVNAGTGLLQGSGGLTITGTTSINTTGSAATNVGNGTAITTIAGTGIVLNTSLL